MVRDNPPTCALSFYTPPPSNLSSSFPLPPVLVFSGVSPSSSVYISSFLKFLNIRSIGSRSLGKNWVGTGEAWDECRRNRRLSLPRPLPPLLLFPSARLIGVVSDKIYPYFIANAATDAPTRLRINYSISVRCSALRFCMLECDHENNFAL